MKALIRKLLVKIPRFSHVHMYSTKEMQQNSGWYGYIENRWLGVLCFIDLNGVSHYEW